MSDATKRGPSAPAWTRKLPASGRASAPSFQSSVSQSPESSGVTRVWDNSGSFFGIPKPSYPRP
eukprot:7759798-Pyramimonas_sp.AAC.1